MRRALAALRRGWRRIPRAGKLCALVAFVNAVVWALLIPPYHVPDEGVHVAYAQYLAETGKLPRHEPGREYSDEQSAYLGAVDFWGTIGNKRDKLPWSQAEQERIEDEIADKPRDNGGFKTVVTNQPPLYYAIQAVAYHATPGAGLLTRLYAMRIASALMAAAMVLCVFLFLRELLPRTPWPWTVGALAVALQPMFGFEAGAVNNDIALYLCSAALFLALARSLRRGLTPWRGVAIGAALGAGLLAKLTMVAFVPAVGLALVVGLWSAAPGLRREALRATGAAVAVGGALLGAYVVANATVWDRPLLQDAAGVSSSASGKRGGERPEVLREQLSYTWQLFAPRLPFMNDHFPGVLPLWDTWFTGFNGRFGWVDYDFGSRFYERIAWLVYLPLIALALAALVRCRRALLRRLPEFAVYATVVVGVVLVIGRPSYTTWIAGEPFPFYQPRYVLPLLPLFGAIVALAVRGAGRRAAPAVGAAIVMLAFAHTLFAQLLTLTRYYA